MFQKLEVFDHGQSNDCKEGEAWQCIIGEVCRGCFMEGVVCSAQHYTLSCRRQEIGAKKQGVIYHFILVRCSTTCHSSQQSHIYTCLGIQHVVVETDFVQSCTNDYNVAFKQMGVSFYTTGDIKFEVQNIKIRICSLIKNQIIKQHIFFYNECI